MTRLHDQGRRLIEESQRILERDVAGALADGDLNLTVRRAQEVVELALKGALKLLCVEYPRIHDVGAAFREQLSRKRPQADQAGVQRIEEASTWLAQARGPALYFEEEYTQEDAQRALEDARFVVDEVRRILDLQKP